MPAGRPPLPFDENAAEQILEAIAKGTGLVTFLKQRPDMPSYPTVMRWVRDNPQFAAQYAQAREDMRSEEHTSELQSLRHLVCRLLLEKKQTHKENIRVM